MPTARRPLPGSRVGALVAALARSESGERAVASALAEVFPWVRHLTAAERGGFAEELIAALSDAAALPVALDPVRGRCEDFGAASACVFMQAGRPHVGAGPGG